MNPKKLYRHLYRVRKRDKPPVVIRMNETLPDDLKADFDRLQAEMDAFEQYFQNDPGIKASFDRLEDELKRMELITK